ncbi:YEATS domain-containing protein 2-like [Amphiura filiformis]|uniref:YEATS domain-containing protein 2-like n=1 Tax=Amphiura filiformis TaxID=82378 RepID=UPI003B20DB19
MATKRSADEMSKANDQDPDYEMVAPVTSSKRVRLLEKDAKDATVKRIEMIIRKQFDIEMRHKEKEVILIDERIHQARAVLDKLRACIVASYYGNVSSYPAISRGEHSKRGKIDVNHPAIQRVIKQTQPPPSSSPSITSNNEGDMTSGIADAADLAALIDESNGDMIMDDGNRPQTPHTPMLNGDIAELLSGCSTPDSEKLSLTDSQDLALSMPGTKGPRNTGQNTFGVGPPLPTPKPIIPQTCEEDGSRFHVKKRIIVGNVSKYISPENREDSDPSTHKWMVYVRGPHNEPRIDHFVKKIWFFLHPSYRPNDLVEVKEPPFHLTRRGWGEFPIRVQLHFVDPRNKKVDIIHHLKLDRTYTGLQTLGAETIVDVELDRYLFDEAGQPVSRPSTPTITNVKYKEGCKPEPTSPGANVVMPTTPSPLLPDNRAKTPSTPMEQSPAASPSLQGSRKGTPTPTSDVMLPPSSKAQVVQSAVGTTLGTMSIKEQGGAVSGVFGTGGVGATCKTQLKPTVGAQLAVQQQQGGRFVRVMPPLGPIRSQAKIALASQGITTTIAKTSSSVVTQPSDAGVPSSKVALPDSDKTPVSTDSPPSISSPPATAVNVADVAASTSPGKTGALNVRIQEGKLVADVSPTAQLTSSTLKSPQPIIAGGVSSTAAAAAAPLPTVTQIMSPVGQMQTVTKVSPQQSLSAALQLTGAVSPGKIPAPVSAPTQPKPGSAGGIKVIPTRTTPLGSPTQGPPTSFPLIPNPPPGTQYYITAKSTDPNLQGKVILIPQQVFAQASGQSVLVGSKGGRPGPSQIQGKGGAALKPTPATKSSFLSPSNVLILPQGSIVPPLPPGSIVQIQQVPSPSRSVQPQPKPRLAVPQKSVSAPALVGARSQAPRVAGIPSGGIIQIQRTTGPSAAKVLSSQLGSTSSPAVPTSGISILPEKGTLAKTPSGGVVFVQRSPSTGKLNAQPVTGISVAGQSGIPQKVALAAQLGSSTLKPPSTVSIIQGGSGKSIPAATCQTVVLQSPTTSLPKLQQVKTIQQAVSRATQPIILGQTSQTAPQAIISPQGKVQLVSVVPEKDAEKQPASLPVELPGQTPMPLSHEVTITTSDNQGSPPEGMPQSSQEVKREPMEDEPSDIPKPPETVKQKVGQVGLPSTSEQGPVTGNQSQLASVSSIIPTESVSHPTTAVVTSHGLVQVQTPGELVSPVATTQPKTSPSGQVVAAAGSLSATLPLAVTTSPLENIQIKQEVISPVKATSSSMASCVTVAPRTFVVPSAPTTLLAPSASATILTPTITGTLLRPVAPGTFPGSIISTKLFGTSPSSTILKPITSSTILGSSLPSTLIAPATIGHQTIILTSALPPVISVQSDKDKGQEPEDPLLVELRKRSREGPVSVYGLETMDDLVKTVAEKIPLVHKNRVQNEHPFMATSDEHYYSWNIGKRRAAEWQRALAIKHVTREAAKRSKKLRDADEWSTKKIMWWCRRHGYTPPDLGNNEAKPREWCNICGEIESPQEGEDMTPHCCTTKWLSTAGLIQNTSYTTSHEFVKKVQEKQQDLGRADDDDSDIEIDVINISTESKQVRGKKEIKEENNRIKCYLPPSNGARLVTDTAHQIGVQFKPVEIAEDTYSNVAQEMIFTATKHFLSDLMRGSFANAYGDRKDHRFPTEIVPTHVFKAINRSKSFDFLTNKYLGIPMPECEDKDEQT